MRPRITVVNDLVTTIPGTKTLWADLLEWFDADWVGAPYENLVRDAELKLSIHPPDLIIRNGTWFGPLDIHGAKTISLIQDIMPVNSYLRGEQIRVARSSTLTVFNTEYTKSKYPELANITSRVIPLPVDFNLFRPIPDAAPVADICWIGAPSWVKGWDILGEIIRNMPTRTFALVLKETDHQKKVPGNVQIFDRLPHSELVKVINGCSVGLCTSREETQHLAGIEMGACGLPVVVPRIGIYYGISDNAAMIHCDSVEQYKHGMEAFLFDPVKSESESEYIRQGWMKMASPERCRASWQEAVEWALSQNEE